METSCEQNTNEHRAICCIIALSVWYSLGNHTLTGNGVPTNLSSIGRYGLGNVQSFNIVYNVGGRTTKTTILQCVLLANLIQVAASGLTQLALAQVGAMCMAREWSHYACHLLPVIRTSWWKRLYLRSRNALGKQALPAMGPPKLAPAKALRVSYPNNDGKEKRGQQRTSYALVLPWRFALPFMGVSAVLQWLLSQSMFLVQVICYNADGSRNFGNDGTNLAYSLLGIILTILLSALLVVCFMAAGYLKFPKNLPVVGTCSAAISAACHRPAEDKDAHLLPIRYGDVHRDQDVGHCCFTTAFDVAPLEEGRKYI